MTDNNQVSYADSYTPPTQAPAPKTAAFYPPQTYPTPEPVAEPAGDTVAAAPVVPAPAAPASDKSQALEDQNIFVLLGVEGTDEEKEGFLDELQQVIWEDFLDKDVELLITEEEMGQLDKVLDDTTLSQAEMQEKVISFLEALVPDLEDIMLEKALDLKEAMVKERLSGMREFNQNQPETLAKIDHAASLIEQNLWSDAADVLNGIS